MLKLSVSSCTAALFLATKLLRLNQNDEVICATQSFRATVLPLITYGIPVRFADIDPDSLNISPDSIAENITAKTKAIYIVHYGGQPCDMDAIMNLAHKHNLYVVEDAAHAMGAEYKGVKAGSFGDLACFSFHSLKNMGCGGEGGLLVINRDELFTPAKKMRSMRSFGELQERPTRTIGPYRQSSQPLNDHSNGAWTHTYSHIHNYGDNYRLSGVQAAIGSAQLRKLEANNQRRRTIAERLNRELSGVEGITVQTFPDHVTHTHHLYTIFYDQEVVGVS